MFGFENGQSGDENIYSIQLFDSIGDELGFHDEYIWSGPGYNVQYCPEFFTDQWFDNGRGGRFKNLLPF